MSALSSIGAEPSDFMLVHEPVDMAIFAYIDGDILVYIEAFKFQTTQQAEEEYMAQRDDKDGGSKL